nr:hypothetical protein [Tanacetum cinerariifolium]
MEEKKPRKPKRQDTELPQTSVPTETVADEAVNEEMYDSLERVTTTATSLDAEQDRGNISKTQSKATPNELSSPETSLGNGARVNTLRSREERLKLKELMELCTKMSDRVLNIETIKTAQAKNIANLKKRFKRLEKNRKSRSHGLKRLYKVGLSARVESSNEESLGEEDASKQRIKIADIDADKGLTLIDETTKDQGRINDEEMFDTYVLNDEEVVIKDVNAASIATAVTAAAIIAVSIDDITLAQALVEIKTSKSKASGIIMQDPSETTTATTIPISLKVQDKGKGIMVEPETPLKKKAQISLDEELAFNLQPEEDEQERITEEKAQLIKDEILAWDDVQAMIDVDYKLAARLQEEEQGELNIEEKSRLIVELMDKRKKHFAKLRAKEKRRKLLNKA